MKKSARILAAFTAAVMTIAPSAGYAVGPGTMGRDIGGPAHHYMPAAKRTAAPFASIIFCRQFAEECATKRSRFNGFKMKLNDDRLAELRDVNNAVNKAIQPVNDSSDTWSLAPASGDCEDFAITKRHLLIAMGWSSQAVRLAIARTPFGEGHMVTVVSTDKGDLVLDNRHSAIREWNKTGLRWVMMQSPNSPAKWVEVALKKR